MPAFVSKIDGVSVPGFWKLTADASAPTVYNLIDKNDIHFKTSSATAGNIYHAADFSNSAVIIPTDAATLDHNDEAFGTSAAICDYLSRWR